MFAEGMWVFLHRFLPEVLVSLYGSGTSSVDQINHNPKTENAKPNKGHAALLLSASARWHRGHGR